MRPSTAALAAAGLIAGYGVAVASGSRPLGGVVLLLFAVPCVVIWARRHGPRPAAALSAVGILAFALSHALGLLIGAWPAVLLIAAAVSIVYWRYSDSRSAVGEPSQAAA